ncbi:1-phosphofructokinase family hexose kinase [Gracilinema caldarium]|uniref:PfkB domain protein n=1 Tax=Gracilinema caldarium (strain ATCC 51460 / DSM 7334 / H1) TaxID=744872 RepID=F8EXE3_GRAC1|nr:PfkB family carbohydrate kinase [Gracilinema caldarium]AEJ19170.1 PfkB domain protein [Gracilinema caldarium DSM 7334]
MNGPHFLSVCLNPTLQKTLLFSSWQRDQVNRTGCHRLDASGKGVNVTRVLTQLGKSVLHLTQLGGNFRDLFINLCEKDDLSLVWVESSSEIRFCYTLIDRNDNSMTELVEESEPVHPGTEQALRELFDRESQKIARTSVKQPTLIISGTKAAGFSDAMIPHMVSRAKELGFRIILDIKGKDLQNSLVYGPDIIKPNLLEFCTTYLPEIDESKIQVDESYQRIVQHEVVSQAQSLVRQFGSSIIITRGPLPVWVIEGTAFYDVPLKSVVPINATGSGDAFTAGLAAALDDQCSLVDAVTEGIRCGSLNAGLLKPGVIHV